MEAEEAIEAESAKTGSSASVDESLFSNAEHRHHHHYHRLYILYERCMVACALYEEYWVRYTRFLIKRGDVEKARHAFVRGTTLFVPSGRTELWLNYAAFIEEFGNGKDMIYSVEAAREIYTRLLGSGEYLQYFFFVS